jgi:uncharacterized membrane protein
MKLTAKFTYKNRISLVSSLFFGLCALFVTFCLYDLVSDHTLKLDIRVIVLVNAVMTLIMGTDILLQVRKHVRIRDVLARLSPEQLKDAILKSLMRMGNRQQIRELGNTLRESIENLKNLKSLLPLPNKRDDDDDSDSEQTEDDNDKPD